MCRLATVHIAANDLAETFALEVAPWRAGRYAVTVLLFLCSLLRGDDVRELPRLEKEFFALCDAGRFPEADATALRLIAIFERSGDPKSLANVLNNIAYAYHHRLHAYAKAESLNRRSLAIREGLSRFANGHGTGRTGPRSGLGG
jgi:hypothetical protein